MSLKIKFLGRGGAFAPLSIGNSNMMITSESGKRLMFDFGSTAPYIYRDEWGLDFREIDAIYISHLHADHCNLELFAFSRYFIPKLDEYGMVVKPKLFMSKSLMKDMWDHTLRGGLESLQGKIMTLTDYFDCKPVSENKHFVWENYSFFPVQTVHIRSGYVIKNSYGLNIHKNHIDSIGREYIESKSDLYITSDTQFDPQLIQFYANSKLIFQDCETGVYRSNVHAHIDDLITLPDYIKEKMWLYHYNEKPNDEKYNDFAGFVEKGQEFIIC